MKRIFLIGTALLLMVLPLAGCGVAQEELDDAIAERDAAKAQVSSLQTALSAAESDLAAAESDLATAESDLATAESAKASADSAKASADSAKATAQSAKAAAESDLAAAEADIAALEAQIADLEAEIAALEAAAEEPVVEEEEEVVEEEEEVVEEEEEEAEVVTEVETSFESATYTNEEYGFSVKYLSDWTVTEITEESAAEGVVLIAAGSFAGYPFPGMYVYVITDGGDTIADVIMAIFGEDTEIDSTTETTTADGTAAWECAVFYYTAASAMDAIMFGAQKDGVWILVSVYTVGQYSPITDQFSEMAHTLLLQ